MCLKNVYRRCKLNNILENAQFSSNRSNSWSVCGRDLCCATEHVGIIPAEKCQLRTVSCLYVWLEHA